MASSPDKLINEAISTIKKAADSFNGALPGIQRDIFAKVVELSRGLEIAQGRLKPSVKNIRQLSRIKRELESVIINPAYKKRVGGLVGTYDKIDRINGEYYKAIQTAYKPTAVFKTLKGELVNETIESLTESGIQANITNRARDILKDSITSGGKFTDYVEQMRQFLTDTKRSDGALSRYAEQITTDSLNQYNAQYNQAAVDDLGLEWYRYVGSLKETSRDWCEKMIAAKAGCMPFVHKSQLGEIAGGKICGSQVSKNPRTGLPEGMMAGTNKDNLLIRRGGYNCGHQFYPVSSALVPKKFRDKYE